MEKLFPLIVVTVSVAISLLALAIFDPMKGIVYYPDEAQHGEKVK